MFQIEADQFATLRKHALSQAMAATFAGSPYRATVDPDNGEVLATDPLCHTTRYGFDRQGYIGTVTSPLGRTWHLHNGPKGRLDGLTSPAGLHIGYDYDDQYQRITRIRRGEHADLDVRYDGRGNPSELGYPDGSRTFFDFQGGDRLTARTNRLGDTERYGYDADGRPVSIANAAGQTTRFEYGDWDRPDRTRFPDGRVESYRYDALGNLTGLH